MSTCKINYASLYDTEVLHELGCILQQVPVSIKQIEDRIRNAVNAKKVRCTEFFKDFDRLRTGYITSKIKTALVYFGTVDRR